MSGMFLSDLHVLTNLTLSCEVGNIINRIKKETVAQRGVPCLGQSLQAGETRHKPRQSYSTATLATIMLCYLLHLDSETF